ncbi:MAG: hypothetical protein QGH72_05590, partial [Dehalococcoidia bacterium]|nr:hypothetical protein [Dehalococcoidia bacterium]
MKALGESGDLGKTELENLSNLQDFAANPKSSIRSSRVLGQKGFDIINPYMRALSGRSMPGVDQQAMFDTVDKGDFETLKNVSFDMLKSGGLQAGFAAHTVGAQSRIPATQASAVSAQARLQRTLSSSTKALTSDFNQLSKTLNQEGGGKGFLGFRGRRHAKQFRGVAQQLAEVQGQSKALEAVAEQTGRPLNERMLATIRSQEKTAAGLGALGAGGMIPGITGLGGGKGGTQGGAKGDVPLVQKMSGLLGGFEMMYISRMLGFATGAMQRGTGALTQQQQAAQGGLYMGGAMEAGWQGEAGSVIQRANRGEAAWANMGRSTQATYGWLQDYASTLPGSKWTGLMASVVGPTAAATMMGAHFGGRFGKEGAIAGALLMGGTVGITSTGAWLTGQGKEETVISDYVRARAEGMEWTPNLEKLHAEWGTGLIPSLVGDTDIGRTYIGVKAEEDYLGWGTPYADTAAKLANLEGARERGDVSFKKWQDAMVGVPGQFSNLT